jgi:hypothetical protein
MTPATNSVATRTHYGADTDRQTPIIFLFLVLILPSLHRRDTAFNICQALIAVWILIAHSPCPAVSLISAHEINIMANGKRRWFGPSYMLFPLTLGRPFRALKSGRKTPARNAHNIGGWLGLCQAFNPLALR